MSHHPIANQLYRHYKGGLYRVITTALHTETNELLVVYKNFNNEVFARPLDMWNENVKVNGKVRSRFDLLYTTSYENSRLFANKIKL